MVSSFLACGGCLSTLATQKDAGIAGVLTGVVADVGIAAAGAAVETDHTSSGQDISYGERFALSLGGVLIGDLLVGAADHAHPN
jgi:hypothetical protein